MQLEIVSENLYNESENIKFSHTKENSNNYVDIENLYDDENKKQSYFTYKKIGSLIVFYYYKGEPYFMIGPYCKNY